MCVMASVAYTVSDSAQGLTFVEVECQTSQGLPGISVVGMANKSIDESKDRLRAAFHSSSLQIPRKKLTFNLAPADTQKEGSGLDVALAAALLTEHTSTPSTSLHSSTVYFGELGLDGTIRPVRGLIGKLLLSRSNKRITTAVVPSSQVKQASLIDGLAVIPLRTLVELKQWLFDGFVPDEITSETLSATLMDAEPEVLVEDIVGHELAKRALEISVAGGHNMMLNGPPGTGKTMLARAVPGILPALNKDQILEITNLHSLSSPHMEALITSPPFRSPHHTASTVSIIGGGQRVLPGEISLASNGVLLLDELPEFRRDCLEALRQPLEEGIVHVSRAKTTITYPASFMLIATKNPCPCGNFGSTKTCSCSAHEIHRYNKKLSGPIMDRIDTYVEVAEVPYASLGKTPEVTGYTTAAIKKRVKDARVRQQSRNPSHKLNSRLSLKQIQTLRMCDSDTMDFLATAAEKLELSGRGYVRTLRLAHTIADLDDAQKVDKKHIAEALQLRPKQQYQY